MTSTRQRLDQKRGHPLLRTVWTALAFPALADTLGLSDRQVEKLSRLKEQSLLFFKAGEVQDKVLGAVGKRTLKQKVGKLAGQPA